MDRYFYSQKENGFFTDLNKAPSDAVEITGENQIPDMSAWKRNPSSNRWRKLPDGTIIQMGISASGPLGSPVNITLPISFSNTNYCVVASYDNARSGVSTMVSFAAGAI